VFNGELMADYRYCNDNAGVSILSWRLLKNCINFKLALTPVAIVDAPCSNHLYLYCILASGESIALQQNHSQCSGMSDLLASLAQETWISSQLAEIIAHDAREAKTPAYPANPAK